MGFPEVDFCENPTVLNVFNMVKDLINIACCFIPIIIILWTTIDVFKIIVSEDDTKSLLKEKGLNFLKRIAVGIITFFAPTLIEALMSLGDMSKYMADYLACYNNASNITYYKELYETKQAELKVNNEEPQSVPSTPNNQTSQQQKAKMLTRATREKKEEVKNKTKNQQEKNKSSDTNPDKQSNSSLGKKHQLTEDQYRKLAAMCVREQGGSEAGVKAEASLMANRFELFPTAKGKTFSNVYEYATQSGWFGSKNASLSEANTKQVEYVKDVLLRGHRTLPGYVDEHDCIDCGSYGYDIVKIKTGSKVITDKTQLKNKSNYVSEQTVLYNKYGATYTFYSFPTSTSDPFGYTSTAYNKYKNK